MRGRPPRRVMIAALALCFSWIAVARSAGAGAAVDQQPTDSWEQFPPTWEKALKTLGDDSLYLLTSPLRFDLESGLVTAGILAGVVGLSLADRSIRHELASHRHGNVRDAANDVSYLGNAGVLLGLNAGAVIVGEAIKEQAGNPRLLDAALVATEAQLLTAGISEGFAYASARSRPADSNDPFTFKRGRDSFPSSHASQAFAVAAVISDRFDQPAGAIAYTLAGLVGVSRLVQDKHWASDVAGGAALGWAVGHFLSVRHSTPHKYLDFFPFAEPWSKTYGLVLQKEF
ncbi:MAG TPA: phosphatase PAP2 family protein [Methylomirabilota bacterium]|nr:phosphatase PAP2 family protein [Methylomirabilota bacterium]